MNSMNKFRKILNNDFHKINLFNKTRFFFSKKESNIVTNDKNSLFKKFSYLFCEPKFNVDQKFKENYKKYSIDVYQHLNNSEKRFINNFSEL